MYAANWIQRWASSWAKTCASLAGASLLSLGLAASADAQGMYPGAYPAMPHAPMYAAPVNTYGYGAPYGYRHGAMPGYSAQPWVMPAAYATHGPAPYGHGNYPCPNPLQEPSPTPGSTGEAAPDGVDDDAVPVPSDEPLPEVADLTGDSAFASADQSAAPNMIGDTIGYGGVGYLVITDGIDTDTLSVAPGGGRKYKAATNNSPVPQTRLYYNFHYFDSALTSSSNGNVWSNDVKRQEFGFEYAVWCDLASIQVTVPFSWSIDSTIIAPDGVVPTPHDTELGNISFALKGVLYQDCYTTFSVGLGVDLPTAEDVYVDNGLATFELDNKAVTISPYAGFLFQPTCNTFFQSFVQLAVPFGSNDITIGGTFEEDIDELKVFHADTSIGAWLYNNGCGTGVAALAELHYTSSVGDEQLVAASNGIVDVAFFEDNISLLHATAGLTLVRNCWTVTPAIVLPLFETPNRFFDWEATVQVNRMF